MGWFKKKDVIDLTRLQKQGILDRAQRISSAQTTPIQTDSGIIDFGSTASSPSQSSSDDSNPLANFFSTDTSPSTSTDFTNSQQSSYGSYTERLRAARTANATDVSALKNKLEDTEYKLERALEKLAIIESRLEEFERRLG